MLIRKLLFKDGICLAGVGIRTQIIAKHQMTFQTVTAFRNMNMMRATRSIRRHAFDEKQALAVWILRPEHIIERSKMDGKPLSWK